MQLQLRDERQALQLMEAVLAGFRERERRIVRALAALEGERTGARRPPASESKPSKPSGASKPSYSWKASEKKVDQVRAVLKGINGEERVSEIARQAGVATETARRALEQLRERDEARITRTRNRAVYYALMPDTGGQRGT